MKKAKICVGLLTLLMLVITVIVIILSLKFNNYGLIFNSGVLSTITFIMIMLYCYLAYASKDEE